jgi:hypothetical protein
MYKLSRPRWPVERKEGSMMYVMPLAIVGRDGLMIAVVTAPFALRRGGASPAGPCVFTNIAKFTAFF